MFRPGRPIKRTGLYRDAIAQVDGNARPCFSSLAGWAHLSVHRARIQTEQRARRQGLPWTRAGEDERLTGRRRPRARIVFPRPVMSRSKA